MKDYILSDVEVQKIISRRRSIPEDVADLIVSHRLLAERVDELERELESWKLRVTERGRRD